MNNIFYKPYVESNDFPPARFPYTREKLLERPIFPTYIFDGGASFFMLDVFKTNNSDDILELILSGKLFEYYTFEGKFDWSGVFKKFYRLEYLHEWEAHIWLNRLYILLPVAQAYLKTKDKKYAKIWYEILMDWFKNNPYKTYENEVNDMVWIDMQVAWRTINMVHSMYMFGEGDAFTKEEWLSIYELLKLHANQLYKEGSEHTKLKSADNHQLQVGMALIMLGTLMPEIFPYYKEYIETGKKIVAINLKYSIYDDGVNNEDSITYSHFIARLYLEAELFLKNNGYTTVDRCAELIQKQYEFLYHFSTRDNKTLQIGDGYSMNAVEDIEFVNSFYPLNFSREKKSMIFEHSRMAVLRNERFEVFIDAMDMQEWHQHYGRPHYAVYIDSKPFVVDTGSVNYDRYDLRARLNSASAHNVIECHEMPIEKHLEKTEAKECLSIESYDISGEKQTITIKNVIQTPDGRFVNWVRTFTLTSDLLVVEDSVEASEKMHFTSYVHTHNSINGYYNFDKPVQPVENGYTKLNNRYDTALYSVETSTRFDVDYDPCVDEKNTMSYSKVIKRNYFEKAFKETTKIIAPKEFY